jgi:hypothetical protein
MSSGKRTGPPFKLTDHQRAELRETFKTLPYGGRVRFYAEQAQRMNVHPLTIKRAVGGGGYALSLTQKIELRREFKAVSTKYGGKTRFYREHAQRLGVNAWTIRNAVIG